MPELPEVETYARQLQPYVAGRTVTGIDVLWDRSIAVPSIDELCRRLIGQTVVDVTRRGKYLTFVLSNGDRLLIHLKMSGRVRIDKSGTARQPHDRVVFFLDDGLEMRFNDMRKFGRVYLVGGDNPVTGPLGPEPLSADFASSDFAALIHKRSGAIKPLLLNQTFLAGLGNIYTDEALYRARIHPLRRANQLTDEEIEALYHAIRDILRLSIESQGTSFDGVYSGALRETSAKYQSYLQVYGRAGLTCPRCQQLIQRIVVGGRGTHVCPSCQRRNDSEGG
jgi:formamidopyrimidine-DNA glycosylase